jgi:SAM-dependent methyltransferase
VSEPAASPLAVLGPGPLTSYWQFRRAVARAQLAAWLPPPRRLLVDISGPAGPGSAQAAARGHTVIRVIPPQQAAGHPPQPPERHRHGAIVPVVADPASLAFLAAGCVDGVIAEDGALSRQLMAEDLAAEVARVLRPGGHYFSQQIGAGSNRELTDFMMGPQPVSPSRDPRRAVAAAEAAGLAVTDLREQALRTVFNDVGAVVYFLRKVLWTVPGFTVEAYQEPLRRMHERIRAEGPFVAHAQRFLIEARKP